MKLSFNKYYIIFGLISWILLFALTLGGPKIYFRTTPLELNQEIYFWVESILCGIIAFVCSYSVSLYIDYKINLKVSVKPYIWKILIAFVFCQVIYSLVIWPILDLAALTIRGNNTTVSFSGKIYNVFYFTTLFFIWLFVFLTIKIYYQLKTVQLRQLQLETNLKELQLNTLKGQLNPHFMFNSLNNIRGLMLEDITKSRDMLTRLSETLRYSLTKNDVDSIAFEDELEMVENYVEISKIQLEDRLRFKTHIDENSLNKQIPPMIVQMLVENAIKHGIATLKEGGEVILTAYIENEKLLISVTNSGKLKQAKDTTQLGVENIKQRLELLYGENATFNLFENNNQVVASIKIPLSS
ncbi:histidine kinase [Flavobacteriaceae bacterium AU392]|nr:histidine kinase [Flavobacteriaceae bacterium]RKM81377.1 histidine kinase [Flavobacteriaceae bacterium AU392]